MADYGSASGTTVFALSVPGTADGTFWTPEDENLLRPPGGGDCTASPSYGRSVGASLQSIAYKETRSNNDGYELESPYGRCTSKAETTMAASDAGTLAVYAAPGGSLSFGSTANDTVDDRAVFVELNKRCSLLSWPQRGWLYGANKWCADTEQRYYKLPERLTETIIEEVNGVRTEVIVNRTSLVKTCTAPGESGSMTISFDLRFGPPIADADGDGVGDAPRGRQPAPGGRRPRQAR